MPLQAESAKGLLAQQEVQGVSGKVQRETGSPSTACTGVLHAQEHWHINLVCLLLAAPRVRSAWQHFWALERDLCRLIALYLFALPGCKVTLQTWDCCRRKRRNARRKKTPKGRGSKEMRKKAAAAQFS